MRGRSCPRPAVCVRRAAGRRQGRGGARPVDRHRRGGQGQERPPHLRRHGFGTGACRRLAAVAVTTRSRWWRLRSTPCAWVAAGERARVPPQRPGHGGGLWRRIHPFLRPHARDRLRSSANHQGRRQSIHRARGVRRSWLIGLALRRLRCLTQDMAAVRCLAFHPTGEFLLAGTDHSAVRLYHPKSNQCFSSPHPPHNHRGPVNGLSWMPAGDAFASCGRDGTVKLWDGVTLALRATLDSPHGQAAVRRAAAGRTTGAPLTDPLVASRRAVQTRGSDWHGALQPQRAVPAHRWKRLVRAALGRPHWCGAHSGVASLSAWSH